MTKRNTGTNSIYESNEFPPLDPALVKQIVLSNLRKYKKEIGDDRRNILKASSLPLGKTRNGMVVVELGKKIPGQEKGDDNNESQREQVKSVVEDLVNVVKNDGERILVVNVNTPAIDLEKNLNQDQLNFIENDIYLNIEDQLGATFDEEVKRQWSNAFKTMMDIVESQKKKPN